MDKAVASFRSSVVGDYELDTEIVDQLCNLFRQNASTLVSTPVRTSKKAEKVEKVEKPSAAEKSEKSEKVEKPSAAEKSAKPAEKADKAPRKKSAYNLFVKEKMQDADIKSLSHKDKMSKIAEKWKTCDKEIYAKMAAELGDVDTLTIVTSQ